ncbi:MAG TPA: choice-of-anchor Q domain-containing protein [Solirubrobacteraceae bacterium]|jgi:hypothetical protein|nr:choice-of-anchor Q domain-containing protein [Solirubrobacteraceae bacterium]
MSAKHSGGVRMRVAMAACLAVCALATLCAGTSWAAVYEAAPGTADSAAGSCSETGTGLFGCSDLRAALTRANSDPGSTVKLAAGRYQLGEAHGFPAGQPAFLRVATSVKVVGAGPQGTTIEQTDGRDPVLVVAHNTSEQSWTIAMEGVKITGGVAAGHEDGEVFLDEEGGGGLRINSSGQHASSTVTLRRDAFVGNLAQARTAHGGAIFNEGTLNVIETSVAQNTALAEGRSNNTELGDAQGGGIFNIGRLLIADSTISANTVQAGGQQSEAVGGGVDSGIYNFSSDNSVAIANTTIVGNLASAGTTKEPPLVVGGGLAMDGGFLNHVTLYDNTASPANAWEAWAGNLYDTYGAGTWIQNSIVAEGHSSEGPNCLFQSFQPEHEVDNLEDDGGLHPECGFSVDDGSLVGISPELQPPAANGGLTETLAPTPGSPVIEASYECEGPFGISGTGWETAIVSLDVDQRGEHRDFPCDIGAFQTERPSVIVPPSIAGTAQVGATLTCDFGSWTGEGTPTYTFEWLRNGVSAGDLTTFYTVAPRDEGSDIACLVTATGTYGSTEATSAVLHVPEGPDEEIPVGKESGEGAPGTEGSSEGKSSSGETPGSISAGEQTGSATSGDAALGGAQSGASPTPRAQTLGTSTVETARPADLLAEHLLPSGRAAGIRELLGRGGVTLSLPGGLRGSLAVEWYLGSKRGLLVARGHGLLSEGTGKLTINLTNAGRRLLERRKRIVLVAYAKLLPSGGPAVQASKRLVLTR